MKKSDPAMVRRLLALAILTTVPCAAPAQEASGVEVEADRLLFEMGEYLARHLALSGNNMTELARRVGQERTHLYRKLKSLGLQTKIQ